MALLHSHSQVVVGHSHTLGVAAHSPAAAGRGAEGSSRDSHGAAGSHGVAGSHWAGSLDMHLEEDVRRA